MTPLADDQSADERGSIRDEPQRGRPSPSSRSARLRYVFALVATVLVLGLLVGRYQAGLAAALKGARPEWILAALGMSTAGVLLGALRWQIVLESMHYRLGFARALQAVMATWPLALVTPSRANDFLRAFAVRRTVPLAAGTGSVLAEKVVDMSLLLGLAAAGAALESLWVWAGLIMAVLAVEVVCVALLVAHRRKLAELPLLRAHAARVRKLEELFVAFDALFGSPARLAWACVVSLVIRGLTLGITYALLRAVDADVDLFDTCALWPAATLIGLVPVTLAGMGTRDATFMYLLAERGHLVTRGNVLAATLGYSAISVGVFAVIGLPFMIRESLYGESA